MRLFLIATVPLVLAVHVQMAIGMNKIAVIALAAAGGLHHQPADQLLLDAQARGCRGDLGDRAHHALLELPDPEASTFSGS